MTESTGADADIDSQKSFYDARWGDEDYANRLKLRRCVYILNALIRIGVDRPKIVELGCGSGWLTSILGHFGATDGFELSPAAVESAAERHRHVSYRQVDLANWTPATAEYDVVVSHEVLEHLENQSEHLSQAHQLLRTNGHLILTTPNADTMNALSDERRATWSTQPIENWITRRQLKTLLRKNGFKVEYITTCILGHGSSGTWRFVNSYRLKTLLRAFGLSRPFDAFRCAAGFGLHLVVVASKSSNL